MSTHEAAIFHFIDRIEVKERRCKMWRLIATVVSFIVVCISLSAVAEVERFVLLFTINTQKESLTVKVKHPPQEVEIEAAEPSPYIGLTNALMLSAEYEDAEGWYLIFSNIDNAYFDGSLVVSGLNQPLLIPPDTNYRLPIGLEGEGTIEGYSNQPPSGLDADVVNYEFLLQNMTSLDSSSPEDSY